MSVSGEDIVGDRVLVGIQSIRISRLSTHPIPLVTGALLAVAGQGPKDSNGAGKSSLIAQISLLQADEQWRFGSGAQSAVDLLFNAEDAGGEDRWGSADHGYVIGVFTDPVAADLARLRERALTVWLRIDRSTQRGPRLKVRWHDGLHLPTGASESEREESADTLWSQLPPRAGRQDLAVRDLPRVLYGEHVRCLSFLSTSVRASLTPNLLAQPLNDIPEHRIFAAIAALTGIDHEIEQERQSRRHEHDRREQVAAAELDLAAWEENTRSVEEGIDARDSARHDLAAAAECWTSRTARLLHDADRRERRLSDLLAEVDTTADQLDRQIREVTAQIRELDDDEAFQLRLRQAQASATALTEADRSLGTEEAVGSRRIEDLDQRYRAAVAAARDADGRTTDQAARERALAEGALEEATKAVGIAEQATRAAAARLAATESCQDLTRRQLDLLAAAGIPAAALLDVVILDERAQARGEATLWPYHDAAVIDRADRAAATAALAELPGSVLVVTDRVPDPTAGTADQLARARQDLASAEEEEHRAASAMTAARVAVRTATRRQAGTRAAGEATDLAATIEELRATLDGVARRRAQLRPELDTARAARDDLVRISATRQSQIAALRARRSALTADRTALGERRAALSEERARLDLADLATRWTGTPATAEQHLLDLPEQRCQWSEDDWWQEARRLITTACARCFPAGQTGPVPTEIADLLAEFDQRGPGSVRRAQAAYDRLYHALHVYLRQQEGYDRHSREQIATQRAERRESLTAAQQGHEEAAGASRAFRSTLTEAIKKKLSAVDAEFDRLDRAYGGYGAGLSFEEPQPPADPTEPWAWKVTPVWRRAEGRRMIPYNRRANTAQMDDRAIKLVCAAAMASGTGRPLMLILDELGRNLGKQHRREAVALLGQIGRDSGITVIGALQDDMEPYAIDACGEYIKLRRSSDSNPYNDQPVIIGYAEQSARVELLRQWLTASGYADPDQLDPTDAGRFDAAADPASGPGEAAARLRSGR